jgi:hypothetical protein
MKNIQFVHFFAPLFIIYSCCTSVLAKDIDAPQKHIKHSSNISESHHDQAEKDSKGIEFKSFSRTSKVESISNTFANTNSIEFMESSKAVEKKEDSRPDNELIRVSKMDILGQRSVYNGSSNDAEAGITTYSDAIAQLTPSLPPVNPAGFTDIPLTSPTSPAAKLIGVEGRITPTIETPSQFGVQILNGLDNSGNFNTGIATDLLPYVLIRGNALTLEDYKKSDLQRFLSNIKLSIATTKAMDNVGAARAGLGLEFTILNEGDLRRDSIYSEEIKAALDEPLKKIRDAKTPLTPAEKQEILNSSDPNVKKVKMKAEQRAAQKPIWTAALGQSWVSPTGLYSDLRGEGMGFWTTYRMGTGGDSQLILHASARNGEQLQLPNKTSVSANTLVGGIRYQTGNSNFRFSLETAYNRENQNGQQINDYLSFGIGVEPRLYDNSWLSLAFSTTSGRQNGNDFQFKTGIKWNINPGYLAQ